MVFTGALHAHKYKQGSKTKCFHGSCKRLNQITFDAEERFLLLVYTAINYVKYLIFPATYK
jgi:hypothetical protein